MKKASIVDTTTTTTTTTSVIQTTVSQTSTQLPEGLSI